MKTILVPTDFSANANNALEYAMEIAKKVETKIVILNVYPIPLVDAYTMASVSLIKDVEERSKLDSIRNLKQTQKLITAFNERNKSEIQSKIISKNDSLVDTILEIIKKEKIGFITMGTQGASGIERALFGSNTVNVMTKTNCTLLAVPAQAKHNNIYQIVYATDSELQETSVIKQLSEFAKLFNAHITVLYIATKARNYFTYKNYSTHNISELVTNLQRKTAYENITVHIKEGDDVIESINDYTSKIHADILAMTTHERNFFEKIIDKSLTKQMAYHTTVPLLIFHADKRKQK